METDETSQQEEAASSINMLAQTAIMLSFLSLSHW